MSIAPSTDAGTEPRLRSRLVGVSVLFMLSSTLVGMCAAAYVWWVFGVQVDAADAFRPAPAAAGYGGVGLVVVGLSVVALAASAIVGYRADRSSPLSAPG